MKILTTPVIVSTLACFLLLGTEHVQAQAAGGGGGGGRNRRDPAQMQAQRMERYREQLEIKGDDEWKLIQERIEKVLQAQRDSRIIGFGVGGFGGAARRGGAAGQADAGANPSGGNRAGRQGTQSNPDVAALQAALDSKATPEEIKQKLAKVRESLKVKEATLAKAQEDLRKVLSVRQEAVAVLLGLLK